ncbi:hypothetical protein SAMN04487770_11347 [Butyrivibrio sp. ob235]|nr:hypothetical protein [Butyrivibrio sp. ob235]SEL60003.1 hypothetical protein SAMN04487770_11347 [Butyrivibrio sp. ob235]
MKKVRHKIALLIVGLMIVSNIGTSQIASAIPSYTITGCDQDGEN